MECCLLCTSSNEISIVVVATLSVVSYILHPIIIYTSTPLHQTHKIAMSVPAKKAAEAVAKKVIPAASRAVSATEAPTIAASAKSSDTESSMPWNGWFTSFLANTMGASNFEKLRRAVVFAPDDIHNLEQIPKPNTKVPLTEDGKLTHMFRYPSPGSQSGKIRQPTVDDGEDPYNVTYHARDTRRRYDDPAYPDEHLEEIKLALMPPDDEAVKEAMAKLEAGPTSSPGNSGRFATGPSDFDPSGLRATMSTNHAAVQKSLDAHMPNHVSSFVLLCMGMIDVHVKFFSYFYFLSDLTLLSTFILDSLNSYLNLTGLTSKMKLLHGIKRIIYQCHLVELDGALFHVKEELRDGNLYPFQNDYARMHSLEE